MFLRSIVSFWKDSIFRSAPNEYKIQEVINHHPHPEVTCEILSSGNIVKFKVIDIFTNKKLHLFSNNDIILLSKLYKGYEPQDTQINLVSSRFQIISLCFIICILASNVAATKIFSFFGYPMAGGTIIFPISFILNDILTEVYGFSRSRKTIWIALLCSLIFSIILYMVSLLPPFKYWDGQESFEKIFSLSPRIVIASASGYLVGETMNSTILSILKIKLKGKYFIVRAAFSTFISAFIETSLFVFIAFSSTLSFQHMISMILILATIKVLYEVISMPITVRIVSHLKSAENTDVYEMPSLSKVIPWGLKKCL